jgi:O-antigen/teichoic acid export membrane protein
MIKRFKDALRTHFDDPLYRSAMTLMANTVATSAFGVVFWVLAARTYPTEVLGQDGALVASMIALSTIAQVNGVSAVWRFLPGMGARTSRALLLAYGLSAAAALVISVLFVVAVPRIDDDFRFVSANFTLAATYVIGMIGWGVIVIGDAAMTALRRARWVFIENLVFAAAKLAALPLLFGIATGHGIYLAWVLPVLLIAPVSNWLIFRRAIPSHVASHPRASTATERFTRRRLVAFLLQDYAGTVMSQGAHTLLPLLVVGLLGSRANAYFFVAWTLVFAFDLLFLNAVTSLTVEGVLREDSVAELARGAIRRLIVPLVAASVVLILLAPVLLIPFGPEYVREAAPVVRLLACASVFRAVLYLFSALCRLRGRGRPLVVIEAGVLLGLVALTATLVPRLGLEGVALAWLITHAVLALVVAQPLRTMVSHPAASAPEVTSRWPAIWRAHGDVLALAARTVARTLRRRSSGRPSGAVATRALIAAIGCLAAPVAVASGAPVALRLAAALMLFALTPGMVVLWPRGDERALADLGPVVVTSLAVATLGAQAMLWLHLWEPNLFLYGLSALCAAGLLMRLVAGEGSR